MNSCYPSPSNNTSTQDAQAAEENTKEEEHISSTAIHLVVLLLPSPSNMSFNTRHNVPPFSTGVASSAYNTRIPSSATSAAPPPLPLTPLSALIPPVNPPHTEPFRGHVAPAQAPTMPVLPALFETSAPLGSSANSPYSRRAMPPMSSLPPISNGYPNSGFPVTKPLSLNPGQMPNGYIPSTAREQPQSFQSLVSDMISHHSFPLIVKKVFEISVCRELLVPEFGSRLNNADRDARTLSNFAHSQGIDNACIRSSSLDVFMAALVTTLDDLKRQTSHERLPRTLQSTLIACAQLHTFTVPSSGASNGGPAGSSFLQVPGQSMQPFATYHRTSSAPRAKLSTSARAILEGWFNDHYANPYPTEDDKLELARRCQIALNQVNNFFGNKRMRIKRKLMALPPAQDSAGRTRNEPTFHPTAVLAPRTKWRAIVLSKVPHASGGTIPGSSAPLPATAAEAGGTGVGAGAGPGTAAGLGSAAAQHGHNAIVDGLFRGSILREVYGNSAMRANAPQVQAVEAAPDISFEQHSRDFSDRKTQ